MSKYKFNNVKILAQSVVVPKKEINIYDEIEYYGNSVKKVDRIRKMAGFYKRRVTEGYVSPSDYAIFAANKVLAETNIDKNSIDAMVYVAQRQDFSQPSTCFYIHKKLNLSKDCAVLTINHGCTGWAYGMWLCSQMISYGSHKRVLLLCGDTPSVGIDPSNRISAPVFGDGGAATILEYNEEAEPIYFNVETYSDGFEAIITPASGARCPFIQSKPEDRKLFNDILDNPIETPSGFKTNIFSGYMDGIAVFDFTISKVPANIKELMNYANIQEDSIDYLCLHQANKQIIQSVGNEVSFPSEKVPFYAFENYGNNTMCSIPTTLNTVVKDNFSNQKTLLCSGFGNGLTVVSLLLTIDETTKLCGVFDWEQPKDFMTRDQYIEYWTDKLKNSNH